MAESYERNNHQPDARRQALYPEPRCIPEKPGISHSGWRRCGVLCAGNPYADRCGVTKMGGSNEPPKEVNCYQRHYYRSSQLCPFRLEWKTR